MRSTIIALSLIVLVANVFSAPTKADFRNTLLRASETSDGIESESLTESVGFLQLFKPLIGTNGQLQGFILSNNNGEKGTVRPQSGWNLPTGMPLNGAVDHAGDVTLQPGALIRPLPAIINQQGASGASIARPARNNQKA
ncbi:unnamed protein product [Adineta ricciae]|uniref:Uncharacterized protein n=1 Tax=Adineta ricciae TaxID=249248 RepID=A0A816E7F0_ADIRI|nr:unnamed protein product [Adineta ricciae]